MTLSNRLTILIGVVFATAAGGGSPTCHAFDSHAAHAWKRTFHTCNAFDHPLRPYFIPRRPGDCSRGPCCTEPSCPPPAAVGFEPLRFERLGHIPNDLAIGAAGR